VVIAALSAILISILGGGLLARSIARPIIELKTVAGRLAAGDYAQRSQVQTGDEIGQMAEAFNQMAGAIQKRDEALNQWNQSLDKRVRERTMQLEEANNEVRESSRLKDEFLAVMSHELRTPLNAIIGFTGISAMTGRLDDDNFHRNQRVRANAERLLNLINDILDISRIESGRLQLVPAEIRVRDLIEKLRRQMDVLAEQKGLQFKVSIDEALPESIYTDEDAVTKIITNLLSNAFKFTKDGEVALSLVCRPDHWIIEARDTGSGIPSHMHEVIFEKFRQVDSSAKREFGGSGLGLSIVRHLVDALDGTIKVSSDVGKGSTFTVTLPLVVPPQVLEEVRDVTYATH
jgi:signal transduction histidine kinase